MKILFFTASAVPTAEEREEASKLPGRVVFRNGSVSDEYDIVESCDAVAGKIPVGYKKKPVAKPDVDEDESSDDQTAEQKPAAQQKPTFGKK